MMTLRKTLSITGIFLLGFIVGMTSLNLLYMHLNKTYINVLLHGIEFEQGLLASKTAREGDTIRSLVHRWNVVDATTANGFRSLRTTTMQDEFFYPFAMLVIKQMQENTQYKEGKVKGERMIEGINRGKLAKTLEALGENELADKQWEWANSLMENRGIKATQRFVEEEIEQENSQLHIDVEDKYLQNP
jgi:hypothetical protein